MGKELEKRFQLEVDDFVKLEIIGYVQSEPDSHCELHKHPFWELIFINDELFGTQLFEECEMPVSQLCLIPPNTFHGFRNANLGGLNKLYIGFSFNYSLYSNPIVFDQFDLKNIPGFNNIIIKLKKISHIMEQNDSVLIGSFMWQIIEVINSIVSFITDSNVNNQNIQKVRSNILVEKVLNYLTQNISQNIKLEDLASMFYLSPHYIGDSFKKETGMSIKKYHNVLRMEYTYRLLSETQLTISEIADKAGFENIHYFSKRFKERYTFPPSFLRKNLAETK